MRTQAVQTRLSGSSPRAAPRISSDNAGLPGALLGTFDSIVLASGSSFATIGSTTPKGSMTGGATWFDFNPGNFQFAIVGVPEPSTWFLAAIGLASLFIFRGALASTQKSL